METISTHPGSITETTMHGSESAIERRTDVTVAAAPPVARPAQPMADLPAEAGRLAGLLVRAARAKRIVEIGSTHGACTAWLAPAAEATGAQHAVIEPDASRVAALEALRDAEDAPLALDIRSGDVVETIPRVPGPLDVAVLNVPDEDVLPAFRALFSRLRVGGVFLALGVSAEAAAAAALTEHQQAATAFLSAGLPVALVCKLG